MPTVTSVGHLSTLGPLPNEWLQRYMWHLDDILKQLQHQYYFGDTPATDDATYDRMFLELQALEVEFPVLAPIDSVTSRVGH